MILENLYGLYKASRNASWQCLLDFHIDRLPVKISQIAKDAGVRLISNSKALTLALNQSGMMIQEDNRFAIIFDDENTPQRCRFTIAHELGHIFLGHGSNGGYSAEDEMSANVFASRLLAPACVLWALDIHDSQEIKELCDISLTAATIRAERMEILYERNKFLTSDLERQVYEQFRPFIDERRGDK